ncbi:MAG: hypothetical protein AAB209_00635, partial [Bacteroidota bacterium]
SLQHIRYLDSRSEPVSPLPLALVRTSIPYESFSLLNLKDVIHSVISPKPSRKSVDLLFDEFNRMAIAYLRVKERGGRLATHVFGITIEDLAVDCIAELFERDKQETFVRLKEYYSKVEPQHIDEDELRGKSRQLVFSEVSNHLFRCYADADPNLHKLIRNLKDVKPSPRVSVRKMSDKWWVWFGNEENNASSLPLMPPEILEFHIAPLIAANSNLRILLDNLADVFDDQAIYRRAYPLVGFAQVLLSAFVRLDEGEPNDSDDLHSLRQDDIKRVIAESVQCVKSDKHSKYVGKGRWTKKRIPHTLWLSPTFLNANIVETATRMNRCLHGYRRG